MELNNMIYEKSLKADIQYALENIKDINVQMEYLYEVARAEFYKGKLEILKEYDIKLKTNENKQ